MRMSVVVGAVLLLSLAAGAVWVHRQMPAPASMSNAVVRSTAHAAMGLARDKGCLACHSTDGAVSIGPSWHGSYGAVRIFADGSSLVIDDNYLRESIVQPAARVVAGYQNLMVAPVLTEQELTQLVELIRQLGVRAKP